ncbi:hypothetical protein Tco_1220359 [Tanacetum coccineum]
MREHYQSSPYFDAITADEQATMGTGMVKKYENECVNLVLADEEKAKAIAFDEINKSPEENKRRLKVATPQVAEKTVRTLDVLHGHAGNLCVQNRYAIDVEPIPPRNRNNREVHIDYLKHLKESVETLREIVKEAKVERLLDSSLAFACLYTKHSQELLEYVIGSCPKDFNQQDKNHAATPLK